MRKELFETGKSVDAAIESACEKLGCLRENCEWEIIDLPKKGFLGLKNIPAKVRVSVEVPDEKPLKAARPQRDESVPELRQRSKPQTQKPQRTGMPEKSKRERQETTQPFASKKAQPVGSEEISDKEALARDYLDEILKASGLKADFVITREYGGSCINIVGEGLGMIIGRRGETLDALQYLTSLVANRGEGDYLRLTVDCGDYRLKRKGTLEALAKKLAGQVLKTNVSKTLEPMNPFERRIIHATVSEIEGVSSSSVGDEPNRRVVITAPGARPASRSGYRNDKDGSRGFSDKSRGPRRDNRAPEDNAENSERGGYNRDRRGGGRDRRGGGGRARQAQPAPQGPPKQTPEAESTVGVSFGKIDL